MGVGVCLGCSKEMSRYWIWGVGMGAGARTGEAVCRGSYLGVDFSLPLLRDADPQPEEFSATFMTMDLTDCQTLKS